MRSLKTADIVSSLVLMLVGALFCRSSLHIGLGNIHAPGPGLIPFGTGALLILFSVATIVEGLVTTNREETPSVAGGGRWWLVLSLLCSLLVYALVLNALGFIPATFLILMLLFKVSRRQSWKGAVLAAVITTAATYLLFGYLLGCSLPSGICGLIGL